MVIAQVLSACRNCYALVLPFRAKYMMPAEKYLRSLK